MSCPAAYSPVERLIRRSALRVLVVALLLLGVVVAAGNTHDSAHADIAGPVAARP